MVVGLRRPHTGVTHKLGGLHRVGVIHVHIGHVGRCNQGHLVAGQLVVVVETAPILLLRQQLGNLSQWTQSRVLLVIPGEDMLTGQQQGRGVLGKVRAPRTCGLQTSSSVKRTARFPQLLRGAVRINRLM